MSHCEKSFTERGKSPLIDINDSELPIVSNKLCLTTEIDHFPFTVSKSRIVQLAQLISSGITVIDTHLGDNGLSTPSFNPDSPVQVVTQEDMVRVKYEVLGATIELRQLLEGPMKLLPESNFAPLAAVYNFDIASKVPIDVTISFADLFSNVMSNVSFATRLYITASFQNLRRAM
ncbi:hypothetical protein H112_05043 [Trichophyton rubrum D6]|uniref:Uncharacterized protein n=2 Tax=Trichophyton TaxID=5550 RepID=A0A022VZM9_TRIRU|nr:hypothetical protein H100_05066 [Trichophyton rubrum MR850]EZF41040.1 hypothetical protein H102_05052 [Trichophyton rubrum CBS 100081]EZF51546.1 hypothetical protein H103_05054 [Trichophyton rubrum CBS 288.86]EZF62291.1 hypothetical protein H104_05047 [Trichophyton rubrum CBS 289.86]EZF72790.1 hypothetical protein H105_05073 [Trichophyton soudanense CBS 452.61]EZF83506.1 hypothetical protein H110_05053 [Trichophyton rubrum MR1448]EZF94153.1 hypothetical protein H113_05092 [Trichophyton rub